MKFKKGIGLLLSLSMTIGCLAGCGDKSKEGNLDIDASQYPFHVEDLKGYEFIVADSNVSRWFPEDGQSDIGNAVIKRVETVEQLFNCKITRIDFDAGEALRAASAGSKYADIIITPIFQMARDLLRPHWLVDMATLDGLNLEAEYWTRWGDTSILKYHDKIYALGAPFACQHDETFVMFFNKTIVEEIKQNRPDLESPEDLYAKDEWTMSKLLEWCKAAKKDLNGDGVFDENDRYGITCGQEFDGPFVLYMGAGGRFLREVEEGHFEFALNTKDAFKIVNQVREILDPWENAWQADARQPVDIANAFANGQTLFYFYSRGRGFADPLYDMKDDFGVVPLPKGDDAGPNEYHCWVSHDAPNMGIMSNNPDIDKTVMIVEALAYFAQEENEIEEGEYLANKLRDDRSREVVENINQYALIDYAWVQWQLDMSGANNGINHMCGIVRGICMHLGDYKNKQIMSSIQAIEKEVAASIQELEDVLNQRNKLE